MKRYIENIRNVHLFSTLRDEELEVISRIMQVKEFQKGQVIFQEGETGDALYVVLQGLVKVSLFDEEGKEYILDFIGKDGFFGELSLIDELPRSAYVTGVENSQFLVIKRQDFMRLLQENPTITISILKTLSKRLRAADERIKGLAFLNVEARILKYLIDVGRKAGVRIKDYIVIEKGPSQIEIASSCGCSRETVSRMIKSLMEKRIIHMRKRQYTLLRPDYTSF